MTPEQSLRTDIELTVRPEQTFYERGVELYQERLDELQKLLGEMSVFPAVLAGYEPPPRIRDWQ